VTERGRRAIQLEVFKEKRGGGAGGRLVNLQKTAPFKRVKIAPLSDETPEK